MCKRPVGGRGKERLAVRRLFLGDFGFVGSNSLRQPVSSESALGRAKHADVPHMRFDTTYVEKPMHPARMAGMILEAHLLTARTLAADDMIL